METKQCPYCGGEIMSTAKKCKHCGEWLEDTPAHPSPNKSAQGTPSPNVEIRQSNSKKFLWLILGAIVLAIVIWIIAVEQEKSEWEETLRENHVISLNVDEPHSFDIQIITCEKAEC